MPLYKEGRDVVEGWKVLKIEVFHGLKDKYGNFDDTNMPTKSLDVYRWWYGQVNLGSPPNNPFQYDSGS